MKYTGAAFLTVATMLCALTIAIAREGTHLGTYEWAVPYLFGTILLCVVLGASLLVMAGRHQERKTSSPPSPPAAISVHLENIGNPTQKQSNGQRVSTPLPKPAAKAEMPEIKPLTSHKARLSDFSQLAGETPILLLPFRNDSVFGQNVGFSAHIIYLDSDGAEIADVSRGTWFPLTADPLRTNFETGMTRELAVLFFANGRPSKPVIHWRHERFHRTTIRHPELWPEADEIKKAIATVEVRLLSGDNEPLIFTFGVTAGSLGPVPSLSRRE